MTYVQAVPIRLIYILLNNHSCYGGCQSQAFNIMNKKGPRIYKKNDRPKRFICEINNAENGSVI